MNGLVRIVGPSVPAVECWPLEPPVLVESEPVELSATTWSSGLGTAPHSRCQPPRIEPTRRDRASGRRFRATRAAFDCRFTIRVPTADDPFEAAPHGADGGDAEPPPPAVKRVPSRTRLAPPTDIVRLDDRLWYVCSRRWRRWRRVAAFHASRAVCLSIRGDCLSLSAAQWHPGG